MYQKHKNLCPEIVIYETVKLKKKNFYNRKIQTSES